MTTSEILVGVFLAHCGYPDIRFEPNGHVPPDFLVDGHIAVEVRRLTQNDEGMNGIEGFDEGEMPLGQKVKRVAVSFGPPRAGVSWFLSFRCRRPVEPWTTLEPKLRSVLTGFINGASLTSEGFLLGHGFELLLFPATNPHSTFFVMGGQTGREASDWFLSDMERNLRRCSREKAETIARVRSKYPEWWLVLTDHIGYGLDDRDRKQFRDQMSLVHEWQKIILLDPTDHTPAFQIYP